MITKNKMDKIVDQIKKMDPVMSGVINDVGECLIGKQKQGFFTYLIGLIIGQKIRFAMARKIRSNLYAETSYTFSPEDILNLTDEQFDKVGVEPYVKVRIIGIARYFANNVSDRNNLTKEVIENISNLGGIGPWTIQTLMIEYGMDLDLFPTNDKYVNRKIKELFQIDDVNEFSNKWRPYRSVVFWYLWKHGLTNS